MFQYNIHTTTIRHFYTKKSTKYVPNVMIICNSENRHTGGSIEFITQPVCFSCLKAICSHKQRILKHWNIVYIYIYVYIKENWLKAMYKQQLNVEWK